MDTLKTPRKRRLVNAAAGPLVRAFVQGRWITLRTEKLGRSKLFLRAKQHVPARAFFEMQIELSPGTAPLRVLASSSFVERSAAGFGVGVDLSSMSTEDQQRWNQYLAQVPQLAALTASSGAQLRPVTQSRAGSVVVVAQALSARAIIRLQEAGLGVEAVATCEEALQRARSGEVGMVVSHSHGAADGLGLALCKELNRECPGVLFVLQTGRDAVEQFERGIQAGAALVIGTPCSEELLLTRLLDQYQREVALPARVDVSALALAIDSGYSRRSLLAQLASWAFAGLLSARQLLGAWAA
jgi:DNA-binding NarL/FixJ family response regulator